VIGERFRLQMVGETVQQRFLIFTVLYPRLAEIPEIGLAFLLHVERMLFAECAHILTKYHRNGIAGAEYGGKRCGVSSKCP